MLYHLATVGLAPILMVQGRRTRRRLPRLLEPPGPRQGVSGRGARLRLLLTGDSAVAGVGAAHQEEALLGRTVAALADSYRVEWTLLARLGATTAGALAGLREADPGRFDVVVTSVGVNDVTRRLPRRDWREQQRELRSYVREELGARCHIVCGLPPMRRFPGLPQPLRWYLGARAQTLDRDLRREIEAADGAHFLDLDPEGAHDVRLMASDGFHPGPGIYAVWGERIAELIRRVYVPVDDPGPPPGEP